MHNHLINNNMSKTYRKSIMPSKVFEINETLAKYITSD